jgi:uncharacterized protein
MDKTTTKPFTPASFQGFLNEHKLMGTRCTGCDGMYLPPRAICPSCHSNALEWAEIPGQGRLAAYTSISICPSFMIDQGFGRDRPYITGIVELEGGLKISARILDVEADRAGSIRIGLPLQADFIDNGEGEEKTVYLAFRPA